MTVADLKPRPDHIEPAVPVGRLDGPGPAYELTKRLLDAGCAAAGILVLLPLLLGCALWIKMVDRGPIFYWQWRAGRNGWLFRLWKFRTMSLNAEDGGAKLAAAGDSRILPGCRWMRKSHVDELPQLWNILKGDMSLVGPRPERPEIIEQLREDVPHIEWRLTGQPGLTGLAQVRNGYSNDLKGMRRKLAFDLKYLRNRSTLGDLRLIAQTLPRCWDTSAC
ncbi:sugar transferase [Mucisphaera calidilacus]|uniref:UDP-N-acetylgalactosamine-undecaprenyl-phosphate N-acetylgalactosaminephosphotransferase n=1 Tax=Mucisphaera calidilacus TaxID=2527982 RepID=A0A518BYT2_9BACT|nr:sugar transferase [Mucisphaera calidilacus]QDU72128.1 UDP-N-acetylgalactosamine-undecaprenyl-phosphate N-acetylgalactosaminephosphotransferase [Mucisphaera calidilacus]